MQEKSVSRDVTATDINRKKEQGQAVPPEIRLLKCTSDDENGMKPIMQHHSLPE